mgnify:CR=1 FL=1
MAMSRTVQKMQIVFLSWLSAWMRSSLVVVGVLGTETSVGFDVLGGGLSGGIGRAWGLRRG